MLINHDLVELKGFFVSLVSLKFKTQQVSDITVVFFSQMMTGLREEMGVKLKEWHCFYNHISWYWHTFLFVPLRKKQFWWNRNTWAYEIKRTPPPRKKNFIFLYLQYFKCLCAVVFILFIDSNYSVSFNCWLSYFQYTSYTAVCSNFSFLYLFLFFSFFLVFSFYSEAFLQQVIQP